MSAASSAASPASGSASEGGSRDRHADVLVLGAGPGGYTAAFRAADLGRQVVLVERYAELGGVCLNVGCIPSKTLLHMAEIVEEVRALADHGIEYGPPKIDLGRIRDRTGAVVKTLTRGLATLAKQRGVQVVRGEGRFTAPRRLAVETPEGDAAISFDHAIVAAGSRATRIPTLPEDPRIMDSTGALALEDVPERLLVVGGGIIGLELATVYEALGSEVTVVEMQDTLMPGVDPELVRPLHRRIEKRYAGILLGTRVASVDAQRDALVVSFRGPGAPAPARFDRILVAVGRRPNGDRIGVEALGLALDEGGFLPVDAQQRTKVPHVFAIGDVASAPLLAHKASHEGKVAAEAIAGLPAASDAAVPSVAYTDPEIAWVGTTESEAEARGVAVRKAVFPWSASGRALGHGRGEGLTKLLFDERSGRLAGAGIVGVRAGELIAEATLAIEMGADAEDLALTIHPHPTLSESVGFAAEMAAGTITDLYVPKRANRKRSRGDSRAS